MVKKISFLIIVLLGSITLNAQQIKAPDLIPFPKTLTTEKGYFTYIGKSLPYSIDTHLKKGHIQAWIEQSLFTNVQKNNVEESNAKLLLKYNVQLGKEAYTLKINEKNIQLSASTQQGAMNGLQTLRQLSLLSESPNKLVLPCLQIEDEPAFTWRGVELDVARHFFSKAYLFKFIDLLASYKFNKLHLHLTDDQGWRIEIKKYPKLTEKGAWRRYNNQDSACIQKAVANPDFNLPKEHTRARNGITEYGGFYTQLDMKEIIAYAADRNIEIIPEIDMPGHMLIATKAYPELLLDSVSAGWGKQFSVPISPWKESTYTFVEDVLTEIIDLFPSKYIHIGADEVEKDTWKSSTAANTFMRQQQIENLHDLQSYFVKRVNKFIRSKNRTAIGWDEIIEGTSDTSMMVMYWRGWEKQAPIESTKRGHRVVMTPTNPLYFDYQPNSSSLDAVYNMAVIPTDIPQNRKYLIQGAQANIWTEMIPSKERLEFMILPRLTALAECVWTNQSLFDSYRKRLVSHYQIWDRAGLRYRMPDLDGFTHNQLIIDGKSTLTVNNSLAASDVHYTTDGSLPSKDSKILKDSLLVHEESKVRFATVSSSGAKSELYEVTFKKGNWEIPAVVNTNTINKGLKASFFKGSFPNTRKIAGTSIREEVIENVTLSDTIKLTAFGTKISGFILIKERGIYNFYFTCDDGGILKIGQQIVIDNDGQHTAIMRSGQIALEAGYYPIEVDFIEAGGGFTLKLDYSLGKSAPKAIPNEWLFH